MAITLDGTTGITTPGLTNTGTETLVNLTTTGNTTLGDATTDTLTVGVTGIVKDASGNVGIGTASPRAAGGYTSLCLNNATTGTFIDFNTAGTRQATITATTALFDFQSALTAPMTFSTNGAVERMRIDSSGNVGIGNTTPLAKLDLGGGTGVKFLNYNGGAGGAQSGLGTDLSGTGNELSIFSGSGSAGVGVISFGQRNSSTAVYTERMRIDSSGYVLINKTSATTYGGIYAQAYTQNTSGQKWVQVWDSTVAAGSCQGLYVAYSGASPNGTGNEFIYCIDSTNVRFQARSNGGVANYSANNVNFSDRREKTNFAPAKSYLDVICAIPVQTYNYIDQNLEEDPGLTLGVVAQDVQEVAPELVNESNWGTKEDPKMRLSIYQTDLQYALMKCIQEQQALIQSLTARITALETP